MTLIDVLMILFLTGENELGEVKDQNLVRK